MPSDIHSKDKQLYTVDDLLEWKPPPVQRLISSGILNIQNRLVIFGDEGSWKSMLALHTAHCLSRGSNWLGFRTSPCNVLKLQVELPMYMDRERVEKYCTGSKRIFLSRNGIGNAPASAVASSSIDVAITSAELDQLESRAINYAYPQNVINRTEQFINIDEKFGFESLKKNIETCITQLSHLPLVVILDPLYKMFNRNLSDEQDAKALFDKLDILMYEIGFSVIIIHHTRKSITDESGESVSKGSQDTFGSRAFNWWADTILRIDPAKNDGTRTRVGLEFTKHRNADRILPTLSLRWNRDTLHPQILSRRVPIDPAEEDELAVRTDIEYGQLE